MAGTTQTAALVQWTVTNQVGQKVVGATDRMLVPTNAFPVVGTGVKRE